jgi:hypothetical protein
MALMVAGTRAPPSYRASFLAARILGSDEPNALVTFIHFGQHASSTLKKSVGTNEPFRNRTHGKREPQSLRNPASIDSSP